ncbi:MAG: hypothetical protein EAZ60_11605 [Oscillatoriales cyanobacterium]|nr:MAG: hypothetical protein EAZ83_18810 [Oscillatoriales cyanobacterium]TAE94517.1 MAG: hypothetical protein EAZ79_23025 [Oscillatoriales cyanobacterium]TAF20640.1 MAG: hypothetical protein EAZ73_11810 [Oscillatoriales cyanobacterium]TAF36362.1 MAG: hypothetical protein EAZ69_10645 [Oscillatoriales cyanobacterium]TAF55897.1 MAG: hypothetical protein EAZ60_11605 [Oscillatoriales cyanobacterium]
MRISLINVFTLLNNIRFLRKILTLLKVKGKGDKAELFFGRLLVILLTARAVFNHIKPLLPVTQECLKNHLLLR